MILSKFKPMYHKYSTIFSKGPDPADEKLFGPEKLRESVDQNAIEDQKKGLHRFCRPECD